MPNVASAITLGSMATQAARTTWTVSAAIVIICWMVAGILFLTSSGSSERLGAAKKALFAAIAGTILVIVAWSAINIISRAIGA